MSGCGTRPAVCRAPIRAGLQHRHMIDRYKIPDLSINKQFGIFGKQESLPLPHSFRVFDVRMCRASGAWKNCAAKQPSTVKACNHLFSSTRWGKLSLSSNSARLRQPEIVGPTCAQTQQNVPITHKSTTSAKYCAAKTVSYLFAGFAQTCRPPGLCMHFTAAMTQGSDLAKARPEGTETAYYSQSKLSGGCWLKTMTSSSADPQQRLSRLPRPDECNTRSM